MSDPFLPASHAYADNAVEQHQRRKQLENMFRIGKQSVELMGGFAFQNIRPLVRETKNCFSFVKFITNLSYVK